MLKIETVSNLTAGILMSDLGLFLKQVVTKPTQVVAVAPSSKALAQRMAEAVPDGAGQVVELGAGTGKITQAMINAGIPDDTIHSFEINDEFCGYLGSSFPSVNVIQDRAENLGEHGIEDIKAVVSGLPLLSMDVATQRAIVGAAFKAIRPGGLYIQFTYGPVPPVCRTVREELNLGWTRSQRIWGNLPPATSYTFYRKHVN